MAKEIFQVIEIMYHELLCNMLHLVIALNEEHHKYNQQNFILFKYYLNSIMVISNAVSFCSK